LVVQVILGGLTVLKLLAYWTVTLHLIFGNLFCLILLTMTLRCREVITPVGLTSAPSTTSRWLVFLGAIVLFAQMVIGGLVSSNHAGVACLQWPTCQGDVWFPTFSGLIGLHIVHRLIAYTLSLITLAIAISARSNARLRKPAFIAVACVVIQVVLGVLNVVWYLPVEITALHSAFAAALVLVYTVLFREALRDHSQQDTDLNRAMGAA
ncbi:MAG: COX15/CtaA family protein, partial [Myxococcota bacterium]|nr:COX15/CtaA family protein [Myxococcota bacterium]